MRTWRGKIGAVLFPNSILKLFENKPIHVISTNHLCADLPSALIICLFSYLQDIFTCLTHHQFSSQLSNFCCPFGFYISVVYISINLGDLFFLISRSTFYHVISYYLKIIFQICFFLLIRFYTAQKEKIIYFFSVLETIALADVW